MVAIKERSHGAPGVHSTYRSRTHLAEHSPHRLLRKIENGAKKAMRDSIDLCHATMHMCVRHERIVALFPMPPAAHSPPWIGAKQIVVVDPAAIVQIAVAAATIQSSGGVDHIHPLRAVEPFVQSTPR